MPIGFDTGLSALIAARTAINTIGQNLANASTPGYSRERVLLETVGGTFSGGLRLGGGVRVNSIERVTDELLLSRLRIQQHEVARRAVGLQNLQEVEQIFGEPGEGGVSALLGNLFNGLSGLGATPDESALRSGVVQAGTALAERIRRIQQDLTSSSQGVGGEIASTADRINAISQALADINERLTAAQGLGPPPTELLDGQSRLLDELATYVDVRVNDLGAGRVRVNVGGQLLVGVNRAIPLTVKKNSDGKTNVILEDAVAPLDVSSGQLRGLLDLEGSGVRERQEGLDRLARSLIREFNEIHATGVPATGGYQSLQASNPLVDTNQNGDFLDELIVNAGLPFDVQNGALLINVIDDATGAITQTTVDIDISSDTVGDLVNRLSAISGLSASVDGTGRLSVSAAIGKRFHFAPTLDSNPDDGNLFGSASGQITGTLTGPFALTSGDAISIAVDGGAPQTITFNGAQFTNISQASATEVAQAINATLVGGVAKVVDGRVVVTSNSQGSTSSVLIGDASGSPTSVLGLSTTLDSGEGQSVSVSITGTYSGTNDEEFTFRPLSDGRIGVTPGLAVEVLDATGQVITTLDVGQGYEPGSSLDVVDGISVSFGVGSISQTAGDRFAVKALADSDSADLLSAFGLAAFFTGGGAEDIDVSQALKDDPSLFAQGLSSAAADNQNISRLLSLRDGALDSLGNRSVEEFYNDMVAKLGTDVSREQLTFETESLLFDALNSRLEQARGVSIDEELANLQRFEQAYSAAARFVQAINDVNQTLLSI